MDALRLKKKKSKLFRWSHWYPPSKWQAGLSFPIKVTIFSWGYRGQGQLWNDKMIYALQFYISHTSLLFTPPFAALFPSPCRESRQHDPRKSPSQRILSGRRNKIGKGGRGSRTKLVRDKPYFVDCPRIAGTNSRITIGMSQLFYRRDMSSNYESKVRGHIGNLVWWWQSTMWLNQNGKSDRRT